MGPKTPSLEEGGSRGEKKKKKPFLVQEVQYFLVRKKFNHRGMFLGLVKPC